MPLTDKTKKKLARLREKYGGKIFYHSNHLDWSDVPSEGAHLLFGIMLALFPRISPNGAKYDFKTRTQTIWYKEKK